MIKAFIYGIILSFGLIIPLGVQNIFVFNQGATQRRFLHALPSVLTATMCDILLIMLAVMGISQVVLNFPWLKITMFIFGFFFLMYMGWVTWNSATRNSLQNEQILTGKKQILFALSVSILNPHAILDTMTVIGTNALNFNGSAKIVYTTACMLVSACWFFGLAIAGHFLHRVDENGVWLKMANKISALIIWGVGFYIAYQAILNI